MEDWFLSPAERGNPATEIDRQHDDGLAYTEGNRVKVLVHGATYFKRLYEELCTLDRDDWVHFTDWEGDPDERLAGPGTEVARVLAELAAKKVHVRGLLWRSHPTQAHFSEQENLKLVRQVNEAGGELLLDERVQHGGSHHQKLFVLRRSGGPDTDVAFVGGIDLAYGRRDDARHEGDPQPVDINPDYGERPPWHDIQLEVHGPAVGDLAYTFRERWEDPTPLDHRNPVRLAVRKLTRQPRRPDPLPRSGTTLLLPDRMQSRWCEPTPPSGRPTRSPRKASAASAGPRHCAVPAGWSTWRTSICGHSPPPMPSRRPSGGNLIYI